MSAEFSIAEYAALNALRVIVKTLNRLCASAESFRDPLLRRLATSSMLTLRECVSEIESYDPSAIARENRAEQVEGQREADIERAATADARDNRKGDVLPRPRDPVAATPQTRMDEPSVVASLVCPHCGATGKDRRFTRFHFDHCKHKDADKTKPRQKREMSEEGKRRFRERVLCLRTCPHCSRQGRGPWMFRLHFDNCRDKPAAAEVVAA